MKNAMISKKTEDVVRRAMEIYDNKLRSTLESTNLNEFVAIEPESGDYFLGKTLSQAIQGSREAYPDRLAFGMRVGHTAAVNIGVLDS